MLKPSQVVDTYFLESRHQLLEIAAYLDRYDAAVARAGDRNGALAVLDTAIVRSREVRDQELAATWRDRLTAIRRALAGEPADLRAALADPRFAALHPYLR